MVCEIVTNSRDWLYLDCGYQLARFLVLARREGKGLRGTLGERGVEQLPVPEKRQNFPNSASSYLAATGYNG